MDVVHLQPTALRFPLARYTAHLECERTDNPVLEAQIERQTLIRAPALQDPIRPLATAPWPAREVSIGYQRVICAYAIQSDKLCWLLPLPQRGTRQRLGISHWLGTLAVAHPNRRASNPREFEPTHRAVTPLGMSAMAASSSRCVTERALRSPSTKMSFITLLDERRNALPSQSIPTAALRRSARIVSRQAPSRLAMRSRRPTIRNPHRVWSAILAVFLANVTPCSVQMP